MDENLQKLEMEIDAELASIFQEFSAPVPASILARTKLAVRHELNEQWFADRVGTPIPLKALAQTKSAVRNELNRREEQHPVFRPDTSGFGSILAIAAMILLCIGLVQYAANFKQHSIESKDPAGESLELFVEAGDVVPQEDMLATIASDLDEVEQNIEQWPESNDWEVEDMENDNSSDSTS